MRVCDLDISDIKVGLKVKGLKTGRIGTIVEIDENDDYYAWIQWDDGSPVVGGFYGNDCKMEIVQ